MRFRRCEIIKYYIIYLVYGTMASKPEPSVSALIFLSDSSAECMRCNFFLNSILNRFFCLKVFGL